MTETWRESDLVISYPNWGDRGRMRGSSVYPPGKLHRPTCRYLAADRRTYASHPSHVYSMTAERWKETVDRVGSYNKHTICTVCCADLKGTLPESD